MIIRLFNNAFVFLPSGYLKSKNRDFFINKETFSKKSLIMHKSYT